MAATKSRQSDSSQCTETALRADSESQSSSPSRNPSLAIISGTEACETVESQDLNIGPPYRNLDPQDERTPDVDTTANSLPANLVPQEEGIDSRNEFTPEDVAFGSVKFLSPWFPSINPELSTWRTKRSRRKFVIWLCFATAFTTFSLNLSLSIVTWTLGKMSNDRVVTLYQGDCSISKRLDTGIHLVINILSTLLLSISNLCLQLLLSPTRAEVDQAHSEKRWLDIGVPSWRNFMNLPVWSKLVWASLATSSVPIHFLYNSVVFSTVSTNSYMYATVTDAFILPQESELTFQLSNGTRVPAPTDYQLALNTQVQNKYADFGYFHPPSNEEKQCMIQIHGDVSANLPMYKKMSNYECLTSYQSAFSWRPHVLLISNDFDVAVNYNTSLFTWGSNTPNAGNNGKLNVVSWTNDPATNWQDVATFDASDGVAWAHSGHHVQYCLSRQNIPGEQEFRDCRVQCAPVILLVVALFNLVKCVSMLWLLYIRPEQTLSTLGDAIASFLEKPDPHTKNCGVATKMSVQASEKRIDTWGEGECRAWLPATTRWYQAASLSRWLVTMTTSLLILIAGTAVLGTGLAVSKRYEGSISFKTLWSFGFGATNAKEIISWNQPTAGALGLIVNIVIANIWQVLVSFCYLAQSALLSCLLIADEWSGFSNERKPLRVSHPRGIQRSTYFVNMPMRYSIPIMILFAIEHWLLSQSTFVIRVINIDIVNSSPREIEGYTTSGFSLVPAIFALVLPSVFLIAQIVNAFMRKYHAKSNMPLVSTCSAAISANCHRPEGDIDAHLLPVQWGVIQEDDDGCQLCSLTTLRTVSAPQTGSQVFTMP
ncbi:hypothetical protein GJ744_006019 [Endocarpon pusillum]|uniref:DUF6536 domain-containing protein n=1 Tax=Endocarpon pusillum TaxID=364733 RepID=A0A8H7E0W7_9EURO|nr:hypothetical protein GJ744_006019 [Endocarpon pusillum]